MKLGFPLEKIRKKKTAGCQPTRTRNQQRIPSNRMGWANERQRTASLGGASSKAFKASAPWKAAVVECPLLESPRVPNHPAFVTVSDDWFWRGYKICFFCVEANVKNSFSDNQRISKNDGWRVIFQESGLHFTRLSSNRLKVEPWKKGMAPHQGGLEDDAWCFFWMETIVDTYI